MTTTTRDTRQTILKEAYRLFHRRGYAGVSMQLVAEAAGISKGNLTYHFPSKQALFEAVHGLAAAYLRDRIFPSAFDGAPDTLSGLENLAVTLRRWLMDDGENFVGCLFTNIAVETRHGDPAIAMLGRQTLFEFKARLAAIMAEGQARGEVRADQPAEALAQAFFWMYEGALTLSRVQNDPAEYDAFRASLRPWLAP